MPTDGSAARLARWHVILIAVVAAVLLIAVGFVVGRVTAGAEATGAPVGDPAVPTAAPTSTATPAISPARDAATAAISALSGVPSTPMTAAPPYDRARFGPAWADVDRNGCDTRNDVLRRDLDDVVIKADTNGCKVFSGTLIDPYDGTIVDFVSGPETSVLVQIDHIVALGWAWHEGAASWSDDARTSFANDPINLVATIGATNQSKGALGPEDWLPTTGAARCTYVVMFVEVLVAYDLSINPEDRGAAEAVLQRCTA